MKSSLLQLEKRIEEIEKLADEVFSLAKDLSLNKNTQPDLSVKAQRWYRGARELLIQNNFSGVDEFDGCYISSSGRGHRAFSDIESYIEKGTNSYHEGEKIWSTENQGREYFGLFSQFFQKARALFLSVVDEVASKEILIKSQLSFSVAGDEFDTAKVIFDENQDDETGLRVSGFITRIALERHLLTVADSRSIEIKLNPPTKKKHDFNDILISMEKAFVITPIQKSELESLFKIGNNCAHPKEEINRGDVERLIIRARELSSVIL